MRWSERRLAMLDAMGIRLWPASPGLAAPDTVEPERGVAVSGGVAGAIPGFLQGDATVASGLGQRDRAAAAAVASASASASASADTVIVVPRRAARSADHDADRQAEGDVPVDVRPATGSPHPPVGAATTVILPVTDWPALREAVAGCRACALGAGRREAIFGSGHERAHWMIVGDAPSEQDEASGEPFAGKSGQLLDNMLRAVGLTRGDAPPARQVYVAHGVKCRPPDGRPPEAGEIEQCSAHLVRQLEWVQPRVVLAMGPVAAQSLLGSAEPIGRLRGRVHRAHGVAVVATFHPFYLLRQPDDKARAWDDLCLALEAARAVQPA